MPIRKNRSTLLLYLLLNIVVSAGTTLAVLAIWDQLRPPTLTRPPEMSTVESNPAVVITSTEPVPTLPPASASVIEIRSVVGAGDLEQESVLLRRLGEGNLLLTGWTLSGEHNNTYIFPPQPELTLYKDGAVEVLSTIGDNTATTVYWDRSEPAWRSGETIVLTDPEGNERARYTIP